MSKKILIVDDNPDIILVFKTFLSHKGYTIIVANSGEECLEALNNETPDLILMDIMMPDGIDGWETTRKIKTNEQTKDIPVSMLSAKGDAESMEKSFNYAYADQHICKPVELDALLTEVEKLT